MKINKGKYLVTGGAGFIGSHLCETLLDNQCDVIAVDNFITGNPENVSHLHSNKKFTLIEQDIITPLKIDGPLTGILHFASPASPIDYQKFPIETLRVGAHGSDNILKLALEKSCPILVASTSEVYGDPKINPQVESYWGNVNPIGPRGCYDESKRYMEALTMAYHRIYGIKTCIIRIFNTYGPRMRTNDGRVVPNFCIQALSGTDLTVYGEGKQTRSFCYIDDLVKGIFHAFASGDKGPINLGNPLELPILEFAKRIIKLSGAKVDITYRPLPEDDPMTRRPDISKAQSLFNWTPTIGLDEGLTATLEHFKSRL